MGAWSVTITGNDTVQDLKSEYQAAFSIMMYQLPCRSLIPMSGTTSMNPTKRNGAITIIHWRTTCGNMVF